MNNVTIELYLKVAILLEEEGETDGAYYALGRAIDIERSQQKHVL